MTASYVRKREWELLQSADGTIDVYHNGKIFQYGAEDLEEAKGVIKRSRIGWVNPVTYHPNDGPLQRL